MYVITNGTEYIMKNRSGKYVTIRNAAMADEFKKEQAQKILNNQIPKKIRKGMCIEKIDDGKKKELPEIETHKDLDFELSQDIKEWVKKIQDLNGLYKEAESKKEMLEVSLHNIDNKINDLAHYVEFGSLNACQGYKVSKKWHDLRCERRQIKNELEVITFILNTKIINTIDCEIDKLITKINNKKYKPRTLQELFDV